MDADNMSISPEQKKAAAAIFMAAAEGKEIEWKTHVDGWVACDPFCSQRGTTQNVFNYPHLYRVKPAPVPWDCAADVPGPVCWLRVDETGAHQMVVSIYTWGMMLIGSLNEDGGKLRWENIPKTAQHSTDRKTWFPCTKPEARP